ncbi:MAG: hypothetical protein QXJ17_03955 [Nitrososphaeria archaeon]
MPTKKKLIIGSEKKILEELFAAKEPLRFKELLNRTGLSTDVLSEGLKRLQNKNLIMRDIKTRRYFALPLSAKIIFYKDLESFFSEVVERIIGRIEAGQFKQDENPEISPSPRWLIVVSKREDFDIRTMFKKYKLELMKNNKYPNLAFTRVVGFLLRMCEIQVLLSFREKERKLIKDYKRQLFKYNRSAYIIKNNEKLRQMYQLVLHSTHIDLMRRYHNIAIPREMIFIEAARKFRILIKSIVSIKTEAEGLEQGEFGSLSEVKKFLCSKRNVRLYNKYLKRRSKIPKTVLLYTLGFGDYLEYLNELFPERSEESILKHLEENMKLTLSNDSDKVCEGIGGGTRYRS